MPQNQNDSENLEDVYDELDEPPSRLGMMTGTLVAIGVASLLIFTGVIWYAFNAGVSTGEEETLPVVRAEPGDVKVKPDDPGGANFAHQDKTVYDKIDGNEAGLEQLLPGAEEPGDKPKVITPYNNELPEEGQPKVVRVAPPAQGSKPAAPAVAPEVSAPEIPDPMGRRKAAMDAGEDVPAEPVEPVTSASPEDADRVAALSREGSPAEESIPETAPEAKQAAPGPDSATVPETTHDADPAAKPAEAGPEKTAALASPATGGKAFVLQLGAFRTQQAADAGWKLLAARHAGVLGSLEHFIVPADLGEKGRFFRLQAGPFPERTAANAQCAALKTAGVDCLVAARQAP
ncbi:MAG TPA: SPOR domain-containing protein [Alphaproteobacteria bacterium]|nr:SPOR domain-containing protein [Alphaproteobacteria bacterium]